MRGPGSARLRAGKEQRPVNQAIAQTVTIAAPVGGWNARDPLAAMPRTDAIILDNFYPGTADVKLRPGMIDFSTGMTGSAKAFLQYNGANTHRLFAATASGIYNVSAQGVVAAAVTTCTNGQWESTNFTNLGNGYLVAVNGVDSLKLYDGTNWTNITGVSTPAITGIATTTLTNVNVFKRRLWFTSGTSMSAWYLAVDAVGGAATEFPMGPLFKLGGYLVAQANWTVDGGAGPDDYLVTVTSEGEMAVYKGTDPSSATTFAIVGVYYVGKPIGKKCFMKYGGDLVYVSQQGISQLSKLLLSATIDRESQLSDKINQAFTDSTTQYGLNFGWCPVLYSKTNAILVNVPITTGQISYQYVMNNLTRSWCRFTGWNMDALIVFQENLYGLLGTKTFLLWIGVSDSGTAITGSCQQAYTDFGGSFQKEISLVRQNAALQGQATVQLGLDSDYQVFSDSSVITYSSTVSTNSWDSATWNTSTWDTGVVQAQTFWQTVPNNPGYSHSFRLQIISSSASYSWTSNNYAIQRMGIL